MVSDYHQIAIKHQHKEKTAFSCHKCHFHFVKKPFGLNNAPASHRRRVDVILIGLKGIDCLQYSDDIICISPIMTEHVKKLYAIFER